MACIKWLTKIEEKENIKIIHALNENEYRIKLSDNKYFKCDGFCKKTNQL